MKGGTGRLIATGTFVCGTLDIADALVFSWVRNHTPSERVLQGIASGFEGRVAYSQGLLGVAIGLCVHYAISFCWVALFVLLMRALPVLARWAVAIGAMYGLVIYGVMNYVVLPQTRIGVRPHAHGASVVNGVLALMVCFGVVLGLLCRGGGR